MKISIKTLDHPQFLEVHLQGTFEEEDVEKFDQLLVSKLTGSRARLLLRLEDFDGWDSLEATWDSLLLMRHHRDDVERMAAVADRPWKGVAARLAGSFSRADTCVFGPEDVAKARGWLHASDV